jgi:hypothetical protein
MEMSRWLRNQWDRTAAVVAVLFGLLSLFLGWRGVSGARLPAEQIPYLASGGLLGLFALGMGATLWLSADLRDEWRKLDAIQRSLEATPEATTPFEDTGRVATEERNGASASASKSKPRRRVTAR